MNFLNQLLFGKVFRMENKLLYNVCRSLMSTEVGCTSTNEQPNDSQTFLSTNAKPNEKLVKVAIIGVPNAGKSTFINNLLNRRICPTSNKVHTTRAVSKAITIKNNLQIIMMDNPGLVTKSEINKFQLEKSFSSSNRHSIQQADFIGVIHDISNSYTRNQIHSTVLTILNEYPKVPSFLVLNKIDAIKSKRVLLDLVRILTENKLAPSIMRKRKETMHLADVNKNQENVPTKYRNKSIGYPNFSNVFMVSSLTGDGMEDVMRYIMSNSQVKNWEHNANDFTDKTPEELIVLSVQARLLDYLPQEIPYKLKAEIEYFDRSKGKIFASVQVTCPSSRIQKLVCGISNGKLKQITERITSDLVETFGIPVSLTISTVIKTTNK